MKYFRSPQPETFIKVRKEVKMSQGRLAKRLNVNRSTICRIEQGKQCPNPDLILKLIKLREELGTRFQLTEQPEITRLKERLSSCPVAEELSYEDVCQVWYAHDLKLEQEEKQLKLLKHKLESALTHDVLDQWVVGGLERMENSKEEIMAVLRNREVDEDVVHCFSNQMAGVQEARKKKSGHSVVMKSYMEMELREEIDLLESRIEQRRARVAFFKDLMEQHRQSLGQSVSTKALQVARPEANSLAINPEGELTEAVGPTTDETLRVDQPRNVAQTNRTQRCVELDHATPHKSKRKRSIDSIGTVSEESEGPSTQECRPEPSKNNELHPPVDLPVGVRIVGDQRTGRTISAGFDLSG